MKRICLLMLFAIPLSCNTTKPDNIVPVETMQKMLMDFHYAEIYSAMQNDSAHEVRNKNLDSLALYYKSIQAHYHVSNEQLTTSIDWYKNNPEQLDSAYGQIITKVSETEASLNKK